MSFLSKFSSMWNGSLGKTTTMKNHINLKPGSCPAVQHQYQAVLETREHEGLDTDRMLKEGLIEPEMSE